MNNILSSLTGHGNQANTNTTTTTTGQTQNPTTGGEDYADKGLYSFFRGTSTDGLALDKLEQKFGQSSGMNIDASKFRSANESIVSILLPLLSKLMIVDRQGS
jgi:hypothetical protein